MSKRTNEGRLKKARPVMEAASPPPLSEELIAKLQNAVNTAQRKRLPSSNEPSANPRPARRPDPRAASEPPHAPGLVAVPRE